MRAACVFAALAFALAAAGARSQPGGFNDASRLATAESLVDRGTLAIDDSVFVRPPPDIAERIPGTDDPDLFYSLRHGTKDRVLIGGHFYSDKPMIPAILAAGAYRVLMPLGLPRPGDRPDVFCRVNTILTCGTGYAAAVGFIWVLGSWVGLRPAWRLVWLLGFALATLLPAYTRNVNAGVPQLAAAAGLAVCLTRVADAGRSRIPWLALLGAGTCVGFAYAVEQASGAPLVLAAVAVVAYRTRRLPAVVAFLLAAAPWAVAHHAINYAVGGVWVPLNMVPEYLDWPGSDFDATNMTGRARHTPATLAVYFGQLFLGDTGFLVCNLPLLLAAGFGWRVLLRPVPDRPELVAMLAWCAAVVGLYTVLSDNWGGSCLSVRWFVPLLVPGFWLLARLLAEFPTYRVDFVVLAAWGLVASWLMWPCGPWLSAPVPEVEVVAWAAGAAWAVVRIRAVIRRIRERERRGLGTVAHAPGSVTAQSPPP
jgi:hypothetical protein